MNMTFYTWQRTCHPILSIKSKQLSDGVSVSWPLRYNRIFDLQEYFSIAQGDGEIHFAERKYSILITILYWEFAIMAVSLRKLVSVRFGVLNSCVLSSSFGCRSLSTEIVNLHNRSQHRSTDVIAYKYCILYQNLITSNRSCLLA